MDDKQNAEEVSFKTDATSAKPKHSDGGLRQTSRTRTNIDRHKKHRRDVLQRLEQNLITCPICGNKGVQIVKFLKNKGSSYTYIEHLAGLEELDDGRVRRKTKLCLIGRIATDDWDIPKTAEGFKAIMGDLLMGLRAMVTTYYSKSPTSTMRSHKAAEDLQNIVNQYERYIVNETDAPGEQI
jgi:hypothetical protein